MFWQNNDGAKTKQTLGIEQRNQILQMNGLDADKLGEARANKLCAALLLDAEKEFNYEHQEKIHPVDPLLTKWFYIHQKESIDKQTMMKKDQMSETAGNASVMKVALTSSSSADGKVKSENPNLDKVACGPHTMMPRGSAG